MISKIPPDEMERRRKASVSAMKAIERERFEVWYQEECDRTYWQRGPCCAGCDHWDSASGRIGQCKAAGIVSGEDVMRSMGITFSSYPFSPGLPYTRDTFHCGLFKDEFDWSTLPEEYLRRIGAKK